MQQDCGGIDTHRQPEQALAIGLLVMRQQSVASARRDDASRALDVHFVNPTPVHFGVGKV